MSGASRSCGCLVADTNRELRERHSHAKQGNHSPEYSVWATMKQRCENRRSEKYKNYGGRGIKVCERWQDFSNFIADMGSRPSPQHTIERIDVDGNYEPGNCCWATQLEQGANRTDNRILTFNGETKHLSAWARELGIDPATLIGRLNSNNWSFEDAMSKTSQRDVLIEHDGLSMTRNEWAAHLGMPYITIYHRLKRLPVHEALNPSLIKPRAYRRRAERNS